jgi:hypothetical protein
MTMFDPLAALADARSELDAVQSDLEQIRAEVDGARERRDRHMALCREAGFTVELIAETADVTRPTVYKAIHRYGATTEVRTRNRFGRETDVARLRNQLADHGAGAGSTDTQLAAVVRELVYGHLTCLSCGQQPCAGTSDSCPDYGSSI